MAYRTKEEDIFKPIPFVFTREQLISFDKELDKYRITKTKEDIPKESFWKSFFDANEGQPVTYLSVGGYFKFLADNNVVIFDDMDNWKKFLTRSDLFGLKLKWPKAYDYYEQKYRALMDLKYKKEFAQQSMDKEFDKLAESFEF